MSQLKVDEIVDASGGSNAVLYGPASPAGSMGFRNRIINGAMMISQRATSASVTNGGYFALDRWRWSQGGSYGAAITPTISQESDAPVGFSNSMKFVVGTGSSPSTSGLAVLEHYIEGFNTADLGFGTANAATVTLSFWVKASITGTYSVYFKNNLLDRTLIKEYTINSANTWEYKTITITGDTSGTWEGATNSTGLLIGIVLGIGSSYTATPDVWGGSSIWGSTNQTQLTETTGATFYITGVQLEVGSVATEFERRPYGTELALCQRYYNEVYVRFRQFTTASGQYLRPPAYYGVKMRTNPTITSSDPTGSSMNYNGSNNQISDHVCWVDIRSSAVSNTGYWYGVIYADAEL